MKNSHPLFWVFLILLFTLLPVMCMRDVSPSNELRYLSIADEAIENGNVFTFTNHGLTYADKPPLYFWLIMLPRLIFGQHVIPVLFLLLSFIPALVTIGVMDRWVLYASEQTSMKVTSSERFATAMMLGTGAMFLGLSVFLRMDMLMCMFITLALHTFYKMYRGQGNYNVQRFTLPFLIFMALFTKGPVGLLMPVLSIVVFLLFMGKIRTIGRYLGWRTWFVLASLCAVWFIGVWLEGGKEYLDNLLFHQTVDRAVDAFHHKRPVWYYFTAIWYVVAPYSLLLVLSLFFSLFKRGFAPDAEKLFVVAVLSTFIMLTIFSGKLSIYLAPIFPFLTYLFLFTYKKTGWGAWIGLSLALPALVLAVLGLALPAALIWGEDIPQLAPLLQQYAFARSPFTYVAGFFFLAGGIAALVFILGRKSWTGAVSSIAVGLLAGVLAVSPLMPQVNDFVGYRNLCEEAQVIKEGEHLSGYTTFAVSRPENMDVFLGEEITILPEDGTQDGDGLSDTVLILKTRALLDHPALAERLQGCFRKSVGDYSLFSIGR